MSQSNHDKPISADAAIEHVTELIQRVARRSREGVRHVATEGLSRLDRYNAETELDDFWVRLGKVAYQLVQAGELDHPALRKAIDRIHDLEDRLRDHPPK